MATTDSLSGRLLGAFSGPENIADSKDEPALTEGEEGIGAFDTEHIEEGRRHSDPSRRVSEMSVVLAEGLGQPLEWRKRLREAALLHDIGKLFVDDQILDKPGSLTEEEYEEVKTHALAGSALLSGGQSTLWQMAQRIARSHHERWDGNGYPDGLESTEIPPAARIVAVADAFEAMTHHRPYRDALPIESAFVVIEQEAGAQFDPIVSKAALQRRDALSALV